MPKIISVGTALPPYEISQEEAKSFSRKMFEDRFKEIERLLQVFDNTTILKRHFCVPATWFDQNHSFEEKNTIYVKNAIELSKKAIMNALSGTPFHTEDIDHIIFISSTGLSTPSIDAFLFNDPELHFNKNVKRTPIWGLGCAGGAAGLSRAFEYALAFPNSKVMVVAVEIGELAFIKNDYSKSNLIATSLFGDGAAAVLITGDKVINNKQKNLMIIDTYSTIWKETLDIMGWDVRNEGLKVIFSKNIPTLIRKELKPELNIFLEKNKISDRQLQFLVLHPGGTKVIEAYEEIFDLKDDQLFFAKKILEQYGNMSSPTVLFVLKEFLSYSTNKEGYGLLLALGPGFSSEALLLKWE